MSKNQWIPRVDYSKMMQLIEREKRQRKVNIVLTWGTLIGTIALAVLKG